MVTLYAGKDFFLDNFPGMFCYYCCCSAYSIIIRFFRIGYSWFIVSYIFSLFLIFSDISRVGEYLYKRAIHPVAVQYLHPKIEFADL